MANFEGLIRGALAAKGDTTPEIRAQVYQSSRNALQRLISSNRSLTVEAAVNEQQALEEAIARIELDYTYVVPEPEEPATGAFVNEAEFVHEAPSVHETVHEEPAPEPQPTTVNPEASDPFYELQQVLGAELTPPQTNTPPAAKQPQPVQVEDQPRIEVGNKARQDPEAGFFAEQGFQAGEAPREEVFSAQTIEEAPAAAPLPPNRDDLYADERPAIPAGFVKRRRSQKTVFWIVTTLIILALLGWIGFRLLTGFLDGSLLGYSPNGGSSLSGPSTATDEQSNYITIVEPGDLTAMVVSDRGRVEIINEQSLEMIRLLSVRDDADRSQSAKPILLRLKPGVIQQIRGKRVTAEIFARSGKSGPSQFSVECVFENQIGCGRKRFRVGVQPEASVFAFTMGRNTDINSEAFIAISTDITESAAITGEGDILDIVYVRLRTTKE